MPRITTKHRWSACLLASVVGCGGDSTALPGTTGEPATTDASVTTTASPDPSTTDLTPTTGSSSVATTDVATTTVSTSEDSSTGDAATSSSATTDTTTSESSTTTPLGETSGTTTGAPDPSCGDGAIDPGETCDDGPNNGPGQACTATCTANLCGDGDAGPGEACDDGNLADGDGCSASCTIESAMAPGKLYLTSANGEPGFHGYTIASDTWTTLASPPEVTCSQITNDGESVYLLGIDNVVYRYDVAADVWAPSAIPGPGDDLVFEPIGYFKWTDQGFFYLHDYDQTLRRYKNGAWQVVPLTKRGASAGSWDPANNELYVRTWAEMGFQVIDTASGAVLRTISDATVVTESSRMGSLSGAYFYTRAFTGTLQKLDAITGTKTDTGLAPTANHGSSDVDVTTGLMYLGGYDDEPSVFQVHDPAKNTLTTLAPSPPVPNHSSLTVMIPL